MIFPGCINSIFPEDLRNASSKIFFEDKSLKDTFSLQQGIHLSLSLKISSSDFTFQFTANR